MRLNAVSIRLIFNFLLFLNLRRRQNKVLELDFRSAPRASQGVGRAVGETAFLATSAPALVDSSESVYASYLLIALNLIRSQAERANHLRALLLPLFQNFLLTLEIPTYVICFRVV